MANWATVANVGDPLSPGWQEKNLTWIEPVKGQRWQVYRPAAAAFEGLLTDLAKLGYSPISSGGFNYRNIRGGDKLSQHAFGTAIDLNALTNPMGQSATDIPQAAELAKKWGLEWGGTWKNRPDPMHFEFTGASTPDAPFNVAQGPPAPPADPQQAFVYNMWPLAVAASQKTGVDPRVILAQSALETGYGKSAPGMNYFGIKGPGGAPQATLEFIGGKMVPTRASFRSYKSPEESFEDYAKFLLQNKRYEPVRTAKGLEAQIAALGASGYATDPEYAKKLQAIAAKIPEGGYGTTGAGPGRGASPGGPLVTPEAPAVATAKEKQPWWKKALADMATADFGVPKKVEPNLPAIPTAAVTQLQPVAPINPQQQELQRQQLAMALARLNQGILWG